MPRSVISSRAASAISTLGTAIVGVWKRSFGISPAVADWKSLQAFDTYGSYQARLTRYSLHWALYENTAYDHHTFSESWKADRGLYKHTRGVVNPIHRLVEMWATMIWNGNLDVEAGDGKSEPTAIPVITKNPDLRPAIAQLWKDSWFNQNKNMIPRLGACLGDVGIRITDDTDKEMMRLDVIHPGTIRWVKRDHWGNVKEYLLEEWRLDPEYGLVGQDAMLNPYQSYPVCLYSEQCWRDGDTVIIRTFKDGELYDWDGMGFERYLDYGFVPFVVINHKKMGPRDLWGWAEHHAGVTKVIESDDLASKLNDQIRKTVEGAWFITNANNSNARRERGGRGRSDHDDGRSGRDDDEDRLSPSRQNMKIIYGGQGGTAVPLLFPLDIQFTTLHLAFLKEVLEKDYPELEFDSQRVAGDASAKALREVKKKAVTKFNDGRVVYDDALVRAHQMAIAIGGYRGYKGYEKFNLDSYKAGKLDHRIGARPVFEVDTLDRYEEAQAFWQAAQTAVLAKCPLKVFVAQMGWTDQMIADLDSAMEHEDARQMKLDAPQVAGTPGTQPPRGEIKNPQTAQTST